MSDMVNHPPHYTKAENGIECWEAMYAMLGKDSYVDHCIASAMKYMWRWRHKNGLEDLQKAQWWLNKGVEIESKDRAQRVARNKPVQ